MTSSYKISFTKHFYKPVELRDILADPDALEQGVRRHDVRNDGGDAVMETYPAYRPTGEVWLPEIPSHWDAQKMKYLFSERSEKGHPDEPLLVASQNMGVVPKNVYGNRTVEAQKDLHLLKLVKRGDFVISLRSFQGGVELAHYQGIISPAYTVMIPNQRITEGYFRYLAKSHAFIQLLKSCVTGIREGQTIDYGKLKNHKIPLPPRDEQDRIVRFLDWKVSLVNRLINLKRGEIKALDSLKRSMVNHAVTRGLSPDAPMKYSGARWLGDIPAHWDCKKIGALFYERRSKVSDTEYPPLSVAKTGVVPQLETALKTDAGDNRKLVRAGDFVINSRSDRKGSCGVSKLDGSVSLINIVLTPRDEWNAGYVHYLMRSQSFSEEYYRNGRGIVADLWTTRFSEMKSILLPVPPRDEQDRVFRLLEERTARLGSLTDKLTAEISALAECRSKLISDVVTGKMDVRDAAIPAYEFAQEKADADGRGVEEPV